MEWQAKIINARNARLLQKLESTATAHSRYYSLLLKAKPIIIDNDVIIAVNICENYKSLNHMALLLTEMGIKQHDLILSHFTHEITFKKTYLEPVLSKNIEPSV